MRKIFIIVLLFVCNNLFAQDAIEYQTPPKEIYDLVMAKPTPGVSFDSKGQYMLILERSSMPSVEYLPSLNYALLACGLTQIILAAAVHTTAPSRLLVFKMKSVLTGRHPKCTMR